MEYADLHIHTTASDGILSPEQVIWWAAKKQLKAISITDHDTINGVAEALLINKQNNDIEIVPGIELNSYFNGEEVHVLGYYIDITDEAFLNKLKEIQDFRYNRALKIIKKLNMLNISISVDQVLSISKGDSVGRPHIARALVKNGYAKDVKDAFNRYLAKDCPAYVERYKLTTKQAIETINNIKGIPVLAHPGLLNNKAIINELLDLGFRGIEVYHSKHDESAVNRFLKIALEKDLLITGGSDCHGKLIDGKPELGNAAIDHGKFIELKKAAISKN